MVFAAVDLMRYGAEQAVSVRPHFHNLQLPLFPQLLPKLVFSSGRVNVLADCCWNRLLQRLSGLSLLLPLNIIFGPPMRVAVSTDRHDP
jgi:hypothetical protein